MVQCINILLTAHFKDHFQTEQKPETRYVTLRQEIEPSCKWWRISCSMRTKKRKKVAMFDCAPSLSCCSAWVTHVWCAIYQWLYFPLCGILSSYSSWGSVSFFMIFKIYLFYIDHISVRRWAELSIDNLSSNLIFTLFILRYTIIFHVLLFRLYFFTYEMIYGKKIN